MTALVISDTVSHAAELVKEFGIVNAVPVSPRSVRYYGAGRGCLVDRIYVDDSITPVADDVAATLTAGLEPGGTLYSLRLSRAG